MNKISREEVYLSPLATVSLVGRKRELARIEEALRDRPHRWTVYITGEGGIGKTRLLQHILQNSPSGLSLRVANRPVDMYHTVNHTVEGLLRSLQEVLSPDGNLFERYLEEREKLERIREPGRGWQEQRGRMIGAFLEDWNKMAQNERIVIGLDTVERLFLHDPIAHHLGISTETSLIYEWLLEEFLPRIHNTVVILAGRPVPVPIEEDLKKTTEKGKFLSLSLSGLTEEEAMEYFQALLPILRESPLPRDRRVADTLSQWGEDIRRMIFYGLRDDGTIRPIFLALAIDYLAISGEPFPVGRSLEEVQSLSPEERKERQKRLVKGVEERIRTDMHPTERIVEALGWLHRGATPDLLSRITGLEGADLEQACERARHLSFVKIRPADERLFLHDEMYALLRDPRGAIPASVFQPLQRYYDDLIERLKETLKETIVGLYQEQSAIPFFEEITRQATRIREALVEDLHYRLHRNAREGFDQYFVYAEEALAIGDPVLDMELWAELLAFWREYDPELKAESVDGLTRPMVWSDAAIRWVKRQIAAGAYDKALSLVQRLRSDARNLLEGADPLMLAELDLVEALVHLYQGNLGEAEKILRKTAQNLEGLQGSREMDTRLTVALARLYNYQGYLRRVQGQFVAAAGAYWKSLPYWRVAKMEAEQANTLTNLAFVLALRGEFDAARRHAMDALSLRSRLGLMRAVSLTLNTLAQIELYAGQYQAAENWALQALGVATKAGSRREEGLACLSLASTYRYMSEPPCPAGRRKGYLEDALRYSQQAQAIFQQVEEPERLAAAYYEEAIAHREFCRPPLIPEVDVQEHARKSEELFQQAMRIARQYAFWALYLDAEMGLAWLYHYRDDESNLLDHIGKLEGFIEERFKEYRITSSAFPQVKEDTILDVFAQMGRLHVLKGIRFLDRFSPEEEREEPPYPLLRKAAREFALALEYDTLVAENFRDLRRALNLIHERLKRFNVSELRAFHEAVAEMAGEFPAPPGGEWRLQKELKVHFGHYDILQ